VFNVFFELAGTFDQRLAYSRAVDFQVGVDQDVA